MAGNAAGGAGFWALRPKAPPAGMDTKEQWRPAASRHPVHQRPRGPDGGGVDHWPHLRGGSAAAAVWFPSRIGRQDGSPTGLLARDAAWAAGGGRRGPARLLHFDSAFAPDAELVPAHRRWAYASRHQGLADSTGGGSHRRATGADHRSATDEAGNPAGRSNFASLANLYFRRFLLAWHNHGHRDQLDAHIVNYADDFVICCRPGNAGEAMTQMTALMTRLGLEVNVTKTRIARLPEESFDFLGYTVGRFHGKDGRSYFGTRPSRKAVKSLLKRIHQRTTRQWYPDEPVSTVGRISSMVRGWCGYFDQGPVIQIYELVRAYTERRVRRWLMRRAGRRGAGFRQIPDEYLYETLGLFSVPRRRVDLPRAKV